MIKIKTKRIKEKILGILTVLIWFSVLFYYWTKDVTVQKFKL